MVNNSNISTILASAPTTIANYQQLYIPPTNASSDKIITAINANLSELNLINNMSNITNNVDQEILVKQNQLLRMKNDELMNQLREIEQIESIITNKNEMIEQTNLNIVNQDVSIKVLTITTVFAILVFISVLLYSLKKIPSKTLAILMCVFFAVYIILMMYIYNIFYFRDAIIYLFFDRTRHRLGEALNKWSDIVKTDIRNDIYGLESDWINNHCACNNSTSESEEENTGVYATNQNISGSEISGYFEYDGSAPPQLLVPLPSVTPNVESIDWVDYSANGQLVYDATNNTTTNVNNQIYNYNLRNPNNTLTTNLSGANRLVNNSTITANM